MIFTEVTLSYPYVQYKVKVSHFTARKSTAIEWVILEAINKCEKLSNYAATPIASLFEQFFTISDADLLIRPVLISLQDIGAITISGIDDKTELDTVAMSNLKLTKTGREMQSQGLLPGTPSEETFSIYYDVDAKALKDEKNLYKEDATGIKIVDIDDADDVDFPEGAIRKWLLTVQRDKKHRRFNWLTPTTEIKSITHLSTEIHWKNITRKVEIVDGMRWKVSGIENEGIDEITLKAFNDSCPDDLRDLPILKIGKLDEEIKKLVPIDKMDALMEEYLQKDDLFCIDAKYYKDIKNNQQKNQKIRIGIVYGAYEFGVEDSERQIIIRIPDCDLKNYGVYLNAENSIKACKINVSVRAMSKEIAIAYIPKRMELNLWKVIEKLVDKYYVRNNTVLFALYKLGLKDKFIKYVDRIVSKELKLADKAKVIEIFNEKSRGYYGPNVISAVDKERILVNEAYIEEQCKNINNAKEIISEYAKIDFFSKDKTRFQKVLKIVIKYVGKQGSLEDIWAFWEVILSVKKEYLNWVTQSGLYKDLYSKKSVFEFISRFDNSFSEIKEYTAVEQILLNMKKISLQVKELVPELNLYDTVRQEKYNELVLTHKVVIGDLYNYVKKWQDEEVKFTNKVIDLSEVLESDTPFTNVKKNMDGLQNALATFFDDSFMRFNRIYIVDTCTLMNEPGLISWFDGEKALLVIPMIVLDELDSLKTSDDEEKACQAREVIRNISNYKAYDWLNTGESSHPELLSDDLDKERNDNKILSIAIRYCAKKPILLTDDTNLGNIATANKIENMTFESYQAMKQHEKIASKGNSKKSKKKKKK